MPRCLSEEAESAAIAPLLVCHRGGNLELHFCARALFAPEFQLRSNSLCPLAHPGYAEVS